MSDVHRVNMASTTIIIIPIIFSFVYTEPSKIICVSRRHVVKVHQQQSMLGMCTTININTIFIQIKVNSWAQINAGAQRYKVNKRLCKIQKGRI